uniref:Ycf54 n=1 Tax=Gracilariopsis longissima TaxID=172976 RepID=A0A345U9B3_9FLOR|nr:hypothetical protein [Gracilariopsis longissima]AXI97049.1 hypothetical protein [Gracilariopsis longissima]UAD88965.1 hypothetical protein [Gracilariopsis longissima]
MNHYYFVIASKHFLMNEEPIEEILRERTVHYKNIQKDIDFWFITNPYFIKSLHINHINKELPENYAAIVSIDQKFIQWLKLRIGFVVIGQFQSDYLLSNIKYT